MSNFNFILKLTFWDISIMDLMLNSIHYGWMNFSCYWAHETAILKKIFMLNMILNTFKNNDV